MSLGRRDKRMRQPKAPIKPAAKKKAAASKKTAAKSAAKRKAPIAKTTAAKRKPAKVAPPVISLADFRADFVETMRRADRDVVCEADADSPSVVNTGWWDGSYDPYDLAPAYKRYLRDPAKLDEILDGVLTRVYSGLPKGGPDSEQKRFS